MPYSALRLAAAVGTGAVALALATPVLAQEHYDNGYSHPHAHYAHYSRHYQRYGSTHHIVVHPHYAQGAPVVTQTTYQGYGWGPVGAVGNVVGGVGDATRGVFYGTGAVVGGVVGGVFGGVNALFGYPYGYNYNPAPGPAYASGYNYANPVAASFAAPFNAAGDVVAAPFQAVGSIGRPQVVSSSETYAPATGAPVYSYESQVGPQPGWAGHCDLIAGNRVCF